MRADRGGEVVCVDDDGQPVGCKVRSDVHEERSAAAQHAGDRDG
jgi:hypothetical protein